MYARDLMHWLHERLDNRASLEQTKSRFESLRGYSLLPKGRQNAGVRLSNEQIASAIMGFAHPLPGFSGHVSLILGDLRPVGGVTASFMGKKSLLDVVAALVGAGDASSGLLRLILSVEQGFSDDEYTAVLHFCENNQIQTVAFVSKYAHSLLQPGAEEGYCHELLDKLTAVQRSYGSKFFRDLARTVSISRELDQPVKTDWREYETEEERAEFNRRLGAVPSSSFLNLRVETQVTWPKVPTRVRFGGHYFVLFPKTKENSHSISIDLTNEKVSPDEARTIINRMLSVMSWCDDQPASLHEGWSGGPNPVPVPKQNLAFMTTQDWYFSRTLPENEGLKKCLAYYRDGLSAYGAGLASHAVLSFFRVFETKYDDKKKVRKWVNAVFPEIKADLSESEYKAFEEDRKSKNVDIGMYVYVNCRVATAHAARDAPSDPDGADETRRLFVAARVMQGLARYFIKREYNYSDSYLMDDAG